MDPAFRDNVMEDLRGVVRGELLFDGLSRALYATDASLFEAEPLGVVVPRDEEDAQALVRYAAEHGVALVPRGGGTGLAGAALGTGLVVDLSVAFTRIHPPEGDTVRAGAGVPLHALQAALAREGRRFVPEPATTQATVGGMVATNASSARALRHGTTRDHLASVRIILDTGEAADVGKLPRWPGEGVQGRLDDIVSSVSTLLEQNAPLLEACRPRVPFDRVGYAVHGALTAHSLDVARLVAGSEGTLGLVTEATLRTQPLAGGRAVALLAFARIDAALRAARLALSTAPTACELLDRRLLRLARGEAPDLVPEGAEAALLVEYEADGPKQAAGMATSLIDWLQRGERLAIWSRPALGEGECDRAWDLPRAGLRAMSALRGVAQPVPIVEDVAVPPEELPALLPRLQDALRRQEAAAAFLIHAGTGQVQILPFLDLKEPRDAEKLWTLADELYPLVLDMGGTISSMHGTGLAR
ncbi:MAG: FAD-binding oxidoreductase, partial [Gemmataceae bacterium]|nr:FAD-binding oxidoreductase [Gemmataceae bacterium]